MLEPAKSCANCHDAAFTVEKYMPGTGKIADNLFVRSHTFVNDLQRKGLPTFQRVPVFYKWLPLIRDAWARLRPHPAAPHAAFPSMDGQPNVASGVVFFEWEEQGQVPLPALRGI